MNTEQRPWRTLVRVVSVDAQTASVVLPAWNSAEVVAVPVGSIPPEIVQNFAQGFRCHARVNIGAERKEDLVFSDWEAS